LRPDSDPLGRYLGCTWPGAPPPSPEELKRRADDHPDLVEVGKIGEFTIYDLWYGRGSYPNLEVRSVLVETATDQYREIDVQVRNGDIFPASEIVKLDDEQILIAKSHDGGNNNNIYEALYMFRPTGAERPDFKAVDRAVKELMPANMSTRTAANDYASMTYRVEAYRNDLNLPPVSVTQRVRIAVTYRFFEGHAVVTSAKYEPYP
jgi:hypothetical protein